MALKKESLMHKIPGMNALISNDMLEDSVKMAEEAISRIKIEQQELFDPLKKAEADKNDAERMFLDASKEYDTLKKKNDAFEEDIQKKKNFITLMSHIKTGKQDPEFYQRISNNDAHKTKDRNSKVDLQGAAVFTLKKLGRFLEPLELINEIFKNVPAIYNELSKRPNFNESRKSLFGANLLLAADRVHKSPNRIKVIQSHEGKIGLPEWFENGTIKAEHAKDFMGQAMAS